MLVANPVGLVVIAIAALAASLVLDYVDSAGHRQFLGGRFVVPRGSWAR
jgi:hypothetical protein